jgi:predicted lipid-binding transport protein (Tim44 family)
MNFMAAFFTLRGGRRRRHQQPEDIMNQAFDPLNLLLLAIAVVVFFKLRSVLGTRTGHENTIDFPTTSEARKPASGTGGNDNSIPPMTEPVRGLPVETPPVWEGIAKEGSALAKTLEKIHGKDEGFSVKKFLDGAGAAYEMIVTAFAGDDKKTLKPLLSKDVYKGFAKAIDERRARDETLELTFVGLDEAKITDASLNARKASLTVRFVSEIITALKKLDGKIIEGDPGRIDTVIDVWTFEHDTGSRDPNWKLVATEAQA